MRSFIISAVLLALAAFPTALAAPAPQRGGVRPIPSRPIPGRPTTRPTPGRPTTTSSRPTTTSRPPSSTSGRPTSSSSSRPPASTPSVPGRPPVGGPGFGLPGKIIGCAITTGVPVPTNQTKIALPAGEKVEFIGLGVGTQNYTCSAAGTYASAGAVAQLYDVSCAANKASLLASLPAFALSLSKARTQVGPQVATKIGGGANPFKLGDHYFFKNAAGANVPMFDFTVSQKKSAFVVAAKKDGIPAPNTATDVDWIQLTRTDGTIGLTTFRINTAGGQPPKTCVSGTSPDVQIQYAANYYFTAPA